MIPPTSLRPSARCSGNFTSQNQRFSPRALTGKAGTERFAPSARTFPIRAATRPVRPATTTAIPTRPNTISIRPEKATQVEAITTGLRIGAASM